MIGITAHPGYLIIFSLNENAATNAAVTTGGFNYAFHDFPFGTSMSNSHAKSENQGLE
jgi:hypothetical protein